MRCAGRQSSRFAVGIEIDDAQLELCYNPTWFGVHLSPHWIRNFF